MGKSSANDSMSDLNCNTLALISGSSSKTRLKSTSLGPEIADTSRASCKPLWMN